MSYRNDRTLSDSPLQRARLRVEAGWTRFESVIVMADGEVTKRTSLQGDVLWSRNEHPLLTASAREWEARSEENPAFMESFC